MHSRSFSLAAMAMAMAIAWLIVTTSVSAQTQSTLSFDYPAQPLIDSLKALSSQSNLNVFFEPKLVSGLKAPGLNAQLTSEEALRRLLKGTGLTYRSVDEKTVMIVSEKESASTAASGDLRGLQIAQSESSTPAVRDKTSSSQAEERDRIEEVVVTGTLIRGASPVGANVVTLSSEDIARTGAISTNDVLAKVPQVSNFFGGLPIATTGRGSSFAAPRIRDLAASSTTTLPLLNGRRVAPAGVAALGFDPDLIPPNVLERVDILADGGSSLYGADAMGGVINYITKKHFNGIEVSGRYGFADNYGMHDINMIGGKDWSSGSAYLSYGYAKHGNLQGSDRDFVTQNLSSHGGTDFRSKSCSPGNVVVSGVNYALPDFVPNSVNLCDKSDTADFYPESARHGVFGGLTQELSSNVSLDVIAYYTTRREASRSDYGAGGLPSRTITSGNPYFSPIGTETQQTVLLDFSDVFPRGALSTFKVETYGVTPAITFNLSDRWKLDTEVNYSESKLTRHGSLLSESGIGAALAGTTAATALNPYDLTATEPAVLQSLLGTEEDYSNNKLTLLTSRATVQGALWTLPAGSLRLATGVEYIRDSVDAIDGSRALSADGISNLRAAKGSRNDKAAFAEVMLPIVSEANALGGIRSLAFSASVRRDHYSDFGSTTNSRFGITYKPVDSLAVRGSYAESFTAPSLADTHAVDARVELDADTFFRAPSSPNSVTSLPSIFLIGGNPGLGPQRGKSYSFGFDFRTPWVDGLSISATYWKMKVDGLIAVAPFFNPNIFFTTSGYSQFYILSPTREQAAALIGNTPVDPCCVQTLDEIYAIGTPYALVDARRNNISLLKTDGIDFNIPYVHRVSFGEVNFGMAGTYLLNRTKTAATGIPAVDDLAIGGYSRFSMTATAGTRVGPVEGLVRLVHRGGYPIPAFAPKQTHVGSYSVVNMSLMYTLKGDRWRDGLELMLNADNVFDQDPPWYNIGTATGDPRGGYGFANGSTLGRLVSVGLRKKF